MTEEDREMQRRLKCAQNRLDLAKLKQSEGNHLDAVGQIYLAIAYLEEAEEILECSDNT